MRRIPLVLAVAAVLAHASGASAASGIPVAHPNPGLTPIHLDYVNPLSHDLSQLQPEVIAAAVSDQKYLGYEKSTDLGGFEPAPVGHSALTTGGHAVIGVTTQPSQLPNYAQAAGGQVKSFVPNGKTTAPPSPAKQPVPGLPPPTNSNTVPPPNQGFAGQPAPNTPSTTEPTPTESTPASSPTTTTAPTTTTTSPTTTTPTTTTPTTTTPTTTTPTTTTPTTTTTVPRTTTTPTTTTVPKTTTTAPTTTTPVPEPPPPPPPPPPTTTTPSPPAPSGGTCGTAGLSITTNLATCSLTATNMAPGGSAVEVLTIENDSGAPFTLSLQATGRQNSLWDDLELGVWQSGTAAPDPLPALVWWTTRDNTLTTLESGQSVSYEVELYLPTTVGNADQGLSASIDLLWHAQG